MKIHPFYSRIIWSFALVNNLYYQEYDISLLPQNLWCGLVYSGINMHWCKAGFFTIGDLPFEEGRIDVNQVRSALTSIGFNQSPYLYCCAFQQALKLYYGVPGTYAPHEDLVLKMKMLLHQCTSQMLSLGKWFSFLHKVPYETPQVEQVFHRMLCDCKITKFWDVNYKILARILAMPKIIVKVYGEENLCFYA